MISHIFYKNSLYLFLLRAISVSYSKYSLFSVWTKTGIKADGEGWNSERVVKGKQWGVTRLAGSELWHLGLGLYF